MSNTATCGHIVVSIFIKYLKGLNFLQVSSRQMIADYRDMHEACVKRCQVLDPGSHRFFQANNYETW